MSQDAEVDLRSGTVDVALRYTKPPFGDGEVVASMPDEVFPACSPAVHARARQASTMQGLLELPRIDSEAPDAMVLPGVAGSR